MNGQELSEEDLRNLRVEAKQFMQTDFGLMLVSTIEEKAEGYLAFARNANCQNPIRYLDRSSGLEEVLETIEQYLDD